MPNKPLEAIRYFTCNKGDAYLNVDVMVLLNHIKRLFCYLSPRDVVMV